MNKCICEVNHRQCKNKKKYPLENPTYCHVHFGSGNCQKNYVTTTETISQPKSQIQIKKNTQ